MKQLDPEVLKVTGEEYLENETEKADHDNFKDSLYVSVVRLDSSLSTMPLVAPAVIMLAPGNISLAPQVDHKAI